MSVTSGFYPSLNGDRKYGVDEFASILDGVINDGVYANVGDCFKITATPDGYMVGTGRAWFNKKWISNDAPILLPFVQPDLHIDRMDAIIFRIWTDTTKRKSEIIYVKGSSDTKEYVLQDTLEIHEYLIASIKVNVGSTEPNQGNIYYKVGQEKTPFVTSILKTTDISALTDQWYSLFNTWFESVKGQLSTDPAGHLQNQINDVVENSKWEELYKPSSIVYAVSLERLFIPKSYSEFDVVHMEIEIFGYFKTIVITPNKTDEKIYCESFGFYNRGTGKYENCIVSFHTKGRYLSDVRGVIQNEDGTWEDYVSNIIVTSVYGKKNR